MYRLYSMKMNSERKTQIDPEELEDDGFEDEDDFYYDEYEDDEPIEREYCD